jgi:hypothetical protein
MLTIPTVVFLYFADTAHCDLSRLYYTLPTVIFQDFADPAQCGLLDRADTAHLWSF